MRRLARSRRSLTALLILVALMSIAAFRWLPRSRADEPPRAELDEKRTLLEPASLKSVPPPATAQEIRQHFLDPPNEFRTAPLWVWNDEMNLERVKEQLRQFKEQGMGQVFVHPRPGLTTEYLSEDWFRLWKGALAEAKQLGLICNIYDENSYPSGFAGGHVPSLAPDTAAQYVQAQIVEAARLSVDNAPWRGPGTLAVFAIERDASGRVSKAARIAERGYPKLQGPAAVFSLRRAGGNPWTGQFPYVDLTHPDTGRLFIETTFEAYKRQVGGEFGKTVKWVFDDEPLLATVGAYEPGQLALPLSFNTLTEFRRRNGYDLRDELPSLFWDVGDWPRIRFDYWQTLHDLWKENYMRPLFLWCDRNGLRFTGHFMEHEWPYPWITPDDASLYAYMHTPGIDMLVGAELRQKGADPHMLFTIRQLASVAHQLGRRAFSETYGVAGWDSVLEHYKRMGDWQIVHGINFIDQHLSFTTVRGARKRDHPQSFSDIAAWWPYYRLHADHTARLCYVMSQGTAGHRLLVLAPTTSGFVWARRGGETPELARLRATFDELNQFLADHQLDFDLGDEYMIEWFGEARGKQLRIGKASYDLLVWPQGMVNVRRHTLPVLEKYLAGGGEILALDAPAAYVDGRVSAAPRQLRERFPAQWHAVSDLQDLLQEIQRWLPPRVAFEQQVPSGIGHRMEILRDGSRVHLFTNSGLSQVTGRAAIEGAALEEWDTVTGRVRTADSRSPTPGKIEFTLDLPPVASRLFYVSMTPGAERAPPRKAAEKTAALTLSDWKISPASPNVLVLDYCDLKVAGQSYADINTWDANWLVWQAHGYERPAWDNAIQFKRRILDHPPFPADSGFEAAFRFLAADVAAIAGAQLALEMPELYKVFVNGQPLDVSQGERWLDPHIRCFPVGMYLKAGENTVRVVGSPFDVRMELENLYLRGNFSVEPEERGFSIRGPRLLQLGSWAKQGYPFYYDTVLYEAAVNVPKRARSLRMSLPRWEGSVVEVLLDGKRVHVVGWQPYVCDTPVTPGRHVVGLRVMATPRNLFGPFHNSAKLRMIAWPAAWAESPEHQPPGAQHDLVDYGLVEPFVVEVVH